MVVPVLSAAVFLASCNTNSKTHDAQLAAQQVTIDSMKQAMQKKAIIDSMNAVAAEREEKVREEEKEKEETKQAVAYQSAAAAPKKSKWNHKAKGAVVGAGTGAVTGALINKKRGQGALVGSLIGAGVGVGTGAIVDNHNKKKQQQ